MVKLSGNVNFTLETVLLAGNKNNIENTDLVSVLNPAQQVAQLHNIYE